MAIQLKAIVYGKLLLKAKQKNTITLLYMLAEV